MHITSSVTSTKSTHDIPVLLLASSDVNGLIHSRRFVPRPSHYHDLVATARKIFHFENDAALVFGTSTLDVCRGDWIEIDESAYELLLECLDEVIVRPRVPHDNGGGNGDETDMGRTRETDRVVDASPILEKNFGDTMSDSRQPDTPTTVVGRSTTSALLAPYRPSVRTESITNTQLSSSPPYPESGLIPNPEPAASKSTKSHLLIQLDVMSKQKSKPPSDSRQRKPEERGAELEIEEKPQHKFRPASATRPRQIQREPEPEPVLRPEPPAARQRMRRHEPEPTMEDVLLEDDERDHGHPSGQKDSIDNEEDENFWRFGTTSAGPSSGSSRKQEPLPRPMISPISNPRSTNIEVKKEPSEEKKIRAARARLSTVNATQLPRASARSLANFDQNPEERFMVTVYGPRRGQGADFRTRGGHKIKKVLESVCRTFQLPFERSQLVLEDDSEDIQYYCDPEETVGACGIDADARLLVQVAGMTDEELNQYGEEEEED